ncbi:hypothetical protein, partial [Parafrankia irregularis]|uniref:hypothetical protein n=1 Tax=Parafrankia irregularis TaxID=795642 RepID=UPI001A958AA7
MFEQPKSSLLTRKTDVSRGSGLDRLVVAGWVGWVRSGGVEADGEAEGVRFADHASHRALRV